MGNIELLYTMSYRQSSYRLFLVIWYANFDKQVNLIINKLEIFSYLNAKEPTKEPLIINELRFNLVNLLGFGINNSPY